MEWESNSNYQAANDRWDRPTPQYNRGRVLFQQPRESNWVIPNETKVVNPRMTDAKVVPNEGPTRQLFKQPRNIDRIIPNTRRSFGFIQQQREPTPTKPRLFLNGRENSRTECHPSCHYDPKKPARTMDKLIPNEPSKLFKEPRDVMRLSDIPGSSPRQPIVFEGHIPWNDRVIPNSSRVFVYPSKDPLEGSSPRRIIDVSKPPRSHLKLTSREGNRLFEKPRETLYTVDSPHPQTHEIIRPPEEPLTERRRLFEIPRPTFKYEDIQGSHPTALYQRRSYNSPTFQSSAFSDCMNESRQR